MSSRGAREQATWFGTQLPVVSPPVGLGLATVGEEYEEYKHLFGEALVLLEA